MIPRRIPWTVQPQYPALLNWAHPLLAGVEYVMLGSQRAYNPTNRQITRVRSNPDILTAGGIGTSIQETEYETYPLPVATGGTTNWTMAGLFIPITLSTSVANTDGNAVAGYCEAPGTTLAWDRTIYLENTTQAWRGHLYDGSSKLATSTATAQVGKLDKVVVTCSGSSLVCAVAGAADATVAVSSNGYNAYSSAEFCLGNPASDGGILQTAVPLFIKANRFWPDSYRKAFFDNPWQIFQSPPIDVWVPSAGAGGGVTGSLAANETGADTAAFTGDVYVTGTLAASETGADTAAFTGDVYVTGTLAASETGADTAAFTGDVYVTGTLAASETGADTAAFTGDVYVTGTLAASETGADIAAFLGAGATPTVYGSFDILETGADVAAILGDVIVVGSMAATETGTDTAAVAGDVYVSGTLAASETGTDTAAFTGIATILPVFGSFDILETGSDVASILGKVFVVGSLAATEVGSDTANFSQGVIVFPPGFTFVASTWQETRVASVRSETTL